MPFVSPLAFTAPHATRWPASPTPPSSACTTRHFAAPSLPAKSAVDPHETRRRITHPRRITRIPRVPLAVACTYPDAPPPGCPPPSPASRSSPLPCNPPRRENRSERRKALRPFPARRRRSHSSRPQRRADRLDLRPPAEANCPTGPAAASAFGPMSNVTTPPFAVAFFTHSTHCASRNLCVPWPPRVPQVGQRVPLRSVQPSARGISANGSFNSPAV